MIVFLLSTLAVVAAYGYLLQCSPAEARALETEDGLIENTGAALFMLSGLLAFFAFSRSRNVDAEMQFARRNWFLLLLALLCIIAAGEEISWGQRIFGWETPAAMKDLNLQGETNLHNLEWFHAKSAGGEAKGQLAKMLNASRLMAIFLVFFLVLVPLLAKTERFRYLFRFFNVPIASWHSGCLFILSYLIFRVSVILAGGAESGLVGAMNELKETTYALVLAVAATGFLSAATSPESEKSTSSRQASG